MLTGLTRFQGPGTRVAGNRGGQRGGRWSSQPSSLFSAVAAHETVAGRMCALCATAWAGQEPGLEVCGWALRGATRQIRGAILDARERSLVGRGRCGGAAYGVEKHTRGGAWDSPRQLDGDLHRRGSWAPPRRVAGPRTAYEAIKRRSPGRLCSPTVTSRTIHQPVGSSATGPLREVRPRIQRREGTLEADRFPEPQAQGR